LSLKLTIHTVMTRIDYTLLDEQILIEILSRHTEDYTKILTDNGNRSELEKLKQTIDAIQVAINAKRDRNPHSRNEPPGAP
jgi:hypothetical protein